MSAAPNHAPDCWNRGVLTSQGYNLVANNSECPFTRATGDRLGTSTAPINPARVLEPLIRNNGRETDTHALIPGSPAIDTGSPAAFNGTNPSYCAREDQRAVVRPVDGNGDSRARCDIGAFEFIRFPTMGIGDRSTLEGSQTKTMNFVVSLSTKSLQTITVNYSTADGTAVAGADYIGAKGRLTFAAGQVSKTISVSVLGDAKKEGSETLSVILSDAVHADLADKQATGTIIDDD